MQGAEISAWAGRRPIHLTALNINHVVEPVDGDDVGQVLQSNVDAIVAAGATAIINHPNFHWALTSGDLIAVEHVKFFELFNGHPAANNYGQGSDGFLSTEAMWDCVLSSGKVLYGIAADDAHVFQGRWASDQSRPGSAWIVVRSQWLGPETVLDAMGRGDFYATTGVSLEDYEANQRSITVTISEKGATRYRTLFIGKHGTTLDETTKNPAKYEIRGDEGYVRAKVLDSNGNVAWLQPMFVGGGPRGDDRSVSGC